LSKSSADLEEARNPFCSFGVDVIHRKNDVLTKTKTQEQTIFKTSKLLIMAPRQFNPAFNSCNDKSLIPSPVKKLNSAASPTYVTAFVVVAAAAQKVPAPQKLVPFCKVVKGACILHITNYTKQEIEACWYNDNEF
jgi:hypothetical protein